MKAVYVLNESQKEQLNKKKIKIKEEPLIGSFTSKDEGNLWEGSTVFLFDSFMLQKISNGGQGWAEYLIRVKWELLRKLSSKNW